MLDAEAGQELVSGLVEQVTDHGAALDSVLHHLPGGLGAVAHRVVHGGDRFRRPVLIDDEVVAEIKALSVLAPLHNPVNAAGIDVARRAFPDLPHVAVFDTAFHATMPPHAYMYALPREWHVRRYGFHGTSHAYVAKAAAAFLGRDVHELDQIVLHLGNGCSATAIQRGRSVDTSMGLTPLGGLVMGTRSGDVDPSLTPHLQRTLGLSVDEIDEVLNQRAGLMALAGANDLRDVHRRIEHDQDRDAAVALAVYCYRIRKYVGSYLAALGGADTIVFTAGVGENDPLVRAQVAARPRAARHQRRPRAQRGRRPGHLARRLAGDGPRHPDRRGAGDGHPGRVAGRLGSLVTASRSSRSRPGRRPTDEASHPWMGSSDQVAFLNAGPDNRCYLLLKGARGAGDRGRARAAVRPDRVRRRRAAGACRSGGDHPYVLALDPDVDFAGDYSFARRWSRRVEVRADEASAGIDVYDVSSFGTLYQRIVDRLIKPDTERQVPGLSHAYHPWFPVLLIGSHKAELYTRALIGDVVHKRHNLADPGWLVRVGLYLELLTGLGIAAAVESRRPADARRAGGRRHVGRPRAQRRGLDAASGRCARSTSTSRSSGRSAR